MLGCENVEDIFEKNKECYQYKGDLEKKAGEGVELRAIFYSPKKNSCLFTTRYLSKEDGFYLENSLIDVFTSEVIINDLLFKFSNEYERTVEVEGLELDREIDNRTFDDIIKEYQ